MSSCSSSALTEAMSLTGALSNSLKSGKSTTVGDLLTAGKPVLLTLNYFTCDSLCSIQLNALVTGMKQMNLVAGQDFTLATVSIDHRNDVKLAASKRESYLQSLGVAGSDWKFMVGTKSNITKLADSVGFDYKYDPETDQFAHNAAIFFLSPDGKISRYLYGIQYSSRDIKFSLMEASLGKIGSVKDRLLLNCFHFDEMTGKYTAIALRIMRIGGILAVACIGLLLGVLWRRDYRKRNLALNSELARSPSPHSSLIGRI